MKGVYEPKIQHNWKITGVDLTAPERADVVELIKAGILTVPASEDGKYTNVASINILDAVTADEIEVLSSKVGVDPAQFKSVKSKGAFYQQLNKARKALSDKDSKGSKDGKDGKDDAATTAPDKPITPSTPKPAPTPTPETAKPDTTKPSKPEDKTSGKQVKVTATYLNVRAGASSKAKVITSVPQGTMLEVISTDRAYGWVKIKLNGRTAFVYGKYVSMMK